MEASTLKLLLDKLKDLEDWRNSFGPYSLDKSQKIDQDKITSVFTELVDRLKGNYPFHHPQYAG
ncbi:MAG TPA: hypothetical protein VJ991_08720, partial [Balneolales bacterium]|nr:hypothetical protein [Balneolales bacterium]